MSDVLLLTVPHTGTTFTEHLLNDHGYVKCALHDNPNRKSLYCGHLGTKERYEAALTAIERGLPLIITLRHPFLVEKSWKGRRKPIELMIEAFRQLESIYCDFRPFVLPVDAEKTRGRQLQLIGEALNLDLKTNWKPKNISQSTYTLSPSEVVPSPRVFDLVNDMSLMKFYD